MAGLSGSYVNESSTVNLTALGAEDFLTFSTSSDVQIRKIGGGSLINCEFYNFNAGGNAGTDGSGGGFQNRPITTTDGTPLNLTNRTTCPYTTADQHGYRITVPAGLDERTVKLLLAHYWENGAVGSAHILGSISGSGAPSNLDLLPSLNLNTDIDLTATFTFTAGEPGQILTIDYYPSVNSPGYTGIRGIWLSAAVASGDILMGQACM